MRLKSRYNTGTWEVWVHRYDNTIYYWGLKVRQDQSIETLGSWYKVVIKADSGDEAARIARLAVNGKCPFGGGL